MTQEATPVRLDDPHLTWGTTTIPGSAPDVRLVRLHVDPATKGSVSLVRFPPGWSRPGPGYYPCAEEFVVLDGWITISGTRVGAGEYGYLPPRADRTDSRVSDSGCLVLAWFSGPPRWSAGAPERPADHDVASGPVERLDRRPRADVPGATSVRAGADPGGNRGGEPDPAPVARDVLSLPARSWAFVPAGAPAPALPGPVVVREWGS